MNDIKYETIKRGFVTKEQAIAIANCDRNLKDSLFKEGKKEGIYYGWLSFKEFDIALVQLGCSFAWHIKVKNGDFGACTVKKIPILNISYRDMLIDGEFDEDSNISCIVMCDSGEYYYGKDIDLSNIKSPNIDEYNQMLSRTNVYID